MISEEDIRELEKKIIEYAERYYRGEAVVSDSQFDSLVENLRKYNPNSVVLKQVGWGYEVKGEKIKHPLVKVKGLEKRRVQPLDKIDFCQITPKFDGANVELIYIDGKLSKAITRGNGEYGQDVTRHLQYLVPQQIASVDEMFSPNLEVIPTIFKQGMVSISGEFLLSRSSKESYFRSELAFRNIPAGFLNRKESTEEECKRFSFQPYRINAIKTRNKLDFESKELCCLTNRFLLQEYLNLIFDTEVPCLDCAYNEETYLTCYRENDVGWDEDVPSKMSYQSALFYFDDYDYFYDGVVVNSSEKLRITETTTEDNQYLYVFNYDEVAYKIDNEYADVTIDSIDWNLTRTGKLVPVANFEGVALSGAIVSRATLHNAFIVERNKITPGTLVRIIRSGEVIPHIIGVLDGDHCQRLIKTEKDPE